MSRSVTYSTLLVFVLSWSLALAFALSGAEYAKGIWGSAMPMLYMFMPLLGAFIYHKLNRSNEAFKEAIGLKWCWNRFFVVAWVGIPFLFIIGGHELINGWIGLSGMLALIGLNLLLFRLLATKDVSKEVR